MSGIVITEESLQGGLKEGCGACTYFAENDFRREVFRGPAQRPGPTFDALRETEISDLKIITSRTQSGLRPNLVHPPSPRCTQMKIRDNLRTN